MRHEDRAEEAEENARRAEAAARAKSADLTRVRSASGAVATTRTSWAFDITDLDAIPLDKIRPYLARDAIEKALRTAVRFGARDIAGVRIFQDDKATFR